MKVTDMIRAEHGLLRDAAWRAAEHEGSGHQWLVLRLVLQHAQAEQDFLLRYLPQTELVKHCYAEHREIHELLEPSHDEGPSDLARYSRGLDLLLGHFDEEERELLPLAERTLQAGQLELLGNGWLQRRGVKQ